MPIGTSWASGSWGNTTWADGSWGAPPAGPEAPTADFTFSIGGLGVAFIDLSDPGSSPITSYAWDFGDATNSNVANPVKTYAAPGTYTVELTVTTADGSDAVQKSVTVSTPVAGTSARRRRRAGWRW